MVWASTPKCPIGGIAYPTDEQEKSGPGGLQKALKSTLLLGMSKLGWLKMLNAFTSYLSWNLSLMVKFLTAPKSKRFWNGPRKMLRPPFV